MNIQAPPPYSSEEAFVVDNVIDKIKVYYKQTGVDTAQTYVELTSNSGKKVTWLDTTFHRVAYLNLGHNAIAYAKPGVREKVQRRREFDKKHERDKAEYERLKGIFG